MINPYPNDAAYLRDELARIDCRLRVEVDRFEGPIDQFGALYISEEEVRALLSDPTRDAAHTGTPVGDQLEEHTTRIRSRRRATRASDDELRFDALVNRFDLGTLDRELLLVALAPELEGRYATVYAYLQDDATRTLPTVDFLVGLLANEADRLDLRARFAADAPLREHGLVQLEGAGPRTRSTVRPDERIVRYLLSGDGIDPYLADVVTVRTPSNERDGPRDAPGHGAALERSAGLGSDPPPVVAVYGPEGSGRAATVGQLCPGSAEPLLSIDADRVAIDSEEFLDRLCREVRLLDATVHVADIGSQDPDVAARLLRRLDRLEGPLFVSDRAEPSPRLREALEEHVLLPVELSRPGYAERRKHWESVPDLPEDVDLDALASTFRLTRGAIADAVQRARAEARIAGEMLSATHVYEACRSQSGNELEDQARQIDPGYDWNDIVLPSDTERRLRELAARIATQGTVYEEWGFEAASSRGTGIVGLFSGPSGTGKTMAAEVVANDAGLDLYRIDLSSVVSKYVGETESNLGRVFDAAANTNAALLFDEADALFGERSDVSDAHDRYANIEVDYLLQRIEEHDGAVLLTSNLGSNIDDAFLRRIHVAIEFPAPDRSARLEIWQGAFPDEAPTADLDLDFLARFDLTGGNIRNVALGAAFLAAESCDPVGMDHLVHALELELEKTGRLIDPDAFGEYREYLE